MMAISETFWYHSIFCAGSSHVNLFHLVKFHKVFTKWKLNVSKCLHATDLLCAAGFHMIYLAAITITMPLLDDWLLYEYIHNELKLLAAFNEVSCFSFIHSAFSNAKSARFFGLPTKSCCRKELCKAALLKWATNWGFQYHLFIHSQPLSLHMVCALSKVITFGFFFFADNMPRKQCSRKTSTFFEVFALGCFKAEFHP